MIRLLLAIINRYPCWLEWGHMWRYSGPRREDRQCARCGFKQYVWAEDDVGNKSWTSW